MASSEFMQGLATGIARASWQSSCLILVVVGLQWLLRRRLAPRWRHALWLPVLVRLVLPIAPASPLSLFQLRSAWTAVDLRTPRPALAPGRTGSIPSLERPLAVSLEAETPGPAARDDSRAMPIESPQVGTSTKAPAVDAPRMVPATAIGPDWLSVLAAIWLSGVVGLGLVQGWGFARLVWRVRRQPPIDDPRLLGVWEECRVVMGVRRPIRILETPEVSGPALLGGGGLRLLLPPGLAGAFSETELRHVFLHELAHVRRHDVGLNWVLAVLQALHWFNPLVWVALGRLRADRELATDALALERTPPGETLNYGHTVIRLLEGYARPAAMPGLVGILEDREQMTRRIQMIAGYRPVSRGSAWQLLLVFLVGLVGLTDEPRLAKGAQSDTPPTVQAPPRPVSAEKAPDEAPRPTDGAVMVVTVLDAETGKPVEGAQVLAPNQVTFFPAGKIGPRWTTSAAGKAEIRLGPVPDEATRQMTWFTLSVSHPGYAPRGFSWSAEREDARRSMPANLEVRLSRGGPIGGVVTEASGKPVPGIQVVARGTGYSYAAWRPGRYATQYPEFWRVRQESPPILTDASGRWRMEDFPKDLENLVLECIRPDGSSESFVSAQPDHNPASEAHGAPLSVEQLRAETFVGVLQGGFAVTGQVLDRQGTPVSGVRIKEGFGAVNLMTSGEFRSDAEGRFVLAHRPRRELILTAEAPGHALTSQVVSVGPDTPEVRLTLDSLSPLRFRVTDPSDRPLQNVEISVDPNRTEAQILDFRAVTGKDGILTWTNAPRAPMTFFAQSQKLKVGRRFRVETGQREASVILRPGMGREIFVEGRAVDADTGDPVKVDSVALQVLFIDAASPVVSVGKPTFRLTVPAERFQQGMSPSYRLRVRATGYATEVTSSRDFEEGDWTLLLRMRRGAGLGGTLRLADGKPAAEARVSVQQDERHFLFMNQPGQVYAGAGIAQTRADHDGRFAVEDPGFDGVILVTHEDGFLRTTVSAMRGKSTFEVPAWGRIEGLMLEGARPLTKSQLMLAAGGIPIAGWNCMLTAESDRQGGFSFDQVPAGEVTLYRSFSPVPGPITPSHPLTVNVRAGEVTPVRFGGTGRPVVGQCAGNLNWTNDVHLLILKESSPDPVQPRLEDFATVAGFERARDRFYEERRRYETKRQNYQLRFEADGAFRVEDVPPGSYELSIRVTDPRPGNSSRGMSGGMGKELASLTREVVVPPIPGGRSDVALDLGLLELRARSGGLPKSPPLELAAARLDGQPLSLGDYRGKYVLLSLGATWADAAGAELAQLTQLYQEFGRNDRLVVVALNLDDDLDRARRSAQSNAPPWVQGLLQGKSRVTALDALHVETLPLNVLLDREGRVVARDLSGPRLVATVQRILDRE